MRVHAAWVLGLPADTLDTSPIFGFLRRWTSDIRDVCRREIILTRPSTFTSLKISSFIAFSNRLHNDGLGSLGSESGYSSLGSGTSFSAKGSLSAASVGFAGDRGDGDGSLDGPKLWALLIARKLMSESNACSCARSAPSPLISVPKLLETCAPFHLGSSRSSLGAARCSRPYRI